jgi:hypothetical protein
LILNALGGALDENANSPSLEASHVAARIYLVFCDFGSDSVVYRYRFYRVWQFGHFDNTDTSLQSGPWLLPPNAAINVPHIEGKIQS